MFGYKNRIAYAFLSFFVLFSSTTFSQETATPPLDEPRIDRVQKPWTAAEAAILAPRENNGRVLGVWSTCANAPALCNAWLEFTDYLLQDTVHTENHDWLTLLGKLCCIRWPWPVPNAKKNSGTTGKPPWLRSRKTT